MSVGRGGRVCTYETRFLVVILGALTPAPKMLAPVIKIPQPAPTTLKPMQSPIPTIAQAYGEVSSRNAPMLKLSPLPINSISEDVSCQQTNVCEKRRKRGGVGVCLPVSNIYNPTAPSVVKPDPPARYSVETIVRGSDLTATFPVRRVKV